MSMNVLSVLTVAMGLTGAEKALDTAKEKAAAAVAANRMRWILMGPSNG
jgi:hypothetical protein